VKLNAKELAALQRIMDVLVDPDLPMVDIQQVTDPAGVGWLRVRLEHPAHGLVKTDLRVSPLGRVYEWGSMDIVFEGPPL